MSKSFSFDEEVAKEFGVEEAVMIRSFQFWIDLKKNLFFCYPYKTLLEPTSVKKEWSFKPISLRIKWLKLNWEFRIPFDWHIKAMIHFAEKYNKKVFIYAGDYDVSEEEFLQRMKIIDKYFE